MISYHAHILHLHDQVYIKYLDTVLTAKWKQFVLLINTKAVDPKNHKMQMMG